MVEQLSSIETALNERIGIDRSVIYDFMLTGINTEKLYGK